MEYFSSADSPIAARVAEEVSACTAQYNNARGNAGCAKPYPHTAGCAKPYPHTAGCAKPYPHPYTAVVLVSSSVLIAFLFAYVSYSLKNDLTAIFFDEHVDFLVRFVCFCFFSETQFDSFIRQLFFFFYVFLLLDASVLYSTINERAN